MKFLSRFTCVSFLVKVNAVITFFVLHLLRIPFQVLIWIFRAKDLITTQFKCNGIMTCMRVVLRRELASSLFLSYLVFLVSLERKDALFLTRKEVTVPFLSRICFSNANLYRLKGKADDRVQDTHKKWWCIILSSKARSCTSSMIYSELDTLGCQGDSCTICFLIPFDYLVSVCT